MIKKTLAATAVALTLAGAGYAFAQQFGVDARVMNHKWRAEAGRESRLRFLAQSLLGAGDLGGVSGDEVIHRLFGRQL